MYWKLVTDNEIDNFKMKAIYGVCEAKSIKEAANTFRDMIHNGLVRAPLEILDNYEDTIVEASQEEFNDFSQFLAEHI